MYTIVYIIKYNSTQRATEMKNIDIFPWNNHFNTGIETIDIQHRKLVVLLNRLATLVVSQSLLSSKSSDDELNNIFDELIEYTLYHFKTEEKIWNKDLNDDSLESEHQVLHQKFVDRVVQLKAQYTKKPLAKVADETLEFLTRWLASHILESDRYMAHVVLALEDGLNLSMAKERAAEKMSGSSGVLIEIILAIYSTLSTNTLHLMRELQSHSVYEKKITYQDKYRTLLFELSTSFINLPLNHIDEAINDALGKMAAFVGADRAYIFDYDFKAKTTTNTFEWCAEDISAQIEELQGIPIEVVMDWPQIHSRGDYVLIQDVLALEDGALRDVLVPQDIQSLVTFPLFENNSCRGFVGFDAVKKQHTFTEGEITLLHLFSELLTNVTDRKNTETALIYERNRFEKYLQTVEAIIISLDAKGHITLINQKGCDILEYTQEELITKQWFEVCLSQPEGMQTIYPAFLEIMAGNIQCSEYFENTIKTKSGKERLIAWHNSYLTDEEGRIIGALSAGEDITERRKAEESLRLAASVFTHSREGIIITSPENKILDVNYAVERISGYSKEELLGRDPNILSSGKQSKSFYKEMWQELQEKGFWNGELSNRRKDGEVYTQMMTISAVKDDSDTLTSYVALFSDISPLKNQQERLEYIAHYDALTGLPNRVLLSDRMHQAMAQTRRNKSTLAVVYLDLDGFKEVNDEHGHDNGDKLLSIVADRMKQTLRDGDTIARLGGDEFVAVFLNLNNPNDCVPMIKRLLNASSETVHYNNLEMSVTASIGVAFFNAEDTTDADQLLRYSDQAMYQAKLLGKNRFHVFDAAQDATLRTHHEKLETIEKALIKNEFRLYYQPKVNMRTGLVIGVEALIRWQHPTRGILSPAEFLPIIEGNVLSVKVGEWVLQEAIEQIQKWKAGGVHLVVSVNIDAIHLLEGDILNYLQELLVRHPGVQFSDFKLEILETSALEDITQVIRIMQECKEIGIAFSLDDFGTGYSSLTYLKRLPVSELKIDQSFVRDMLHDPDDLAILDGVISLAGAFRREVVAEGVESIRQGNVLLRMGCDVAQGYIIARPMPARNVEKWILEWKPDANWFGVSPVTRDELPILYAIVEHTAWVNSVIAYVQGRHSFMPEQNHYECRFGQLFYALGSKGYEEYTEFKRIENLHIDIHLKAKAIIQAKDNFSADFEKELLEFKKIHQNLIDALESTTLLPYQPMKQQLK